MKGKQMSMFSDTDGWTLDKEKTFAKLWVRPRRGDKVTYSYRGEIAIKPYPNPLRFGGLWTSGGAETEEGLRGAIAEFGRAVAYFKKRGIPLKLEIIREPEERGYRSPATLDL